jgi:hypothetical protein
VLILGAAPFEAGEAPRRTMAEGATSADGLPPAQRCALGRRRNAVGIDREGLDGREGFWGGRPEAGLRANSTSVLPVFRQLANGAKTTTLQTGSVIEEAATSRSAKRLMVQKPT